jgi:hypothetical protein
MLQELQAADARHHGIQENQVKVSLPENLQTFCAVFGD